jgi:hypothetical protein
MATENGGRVMKKRMEIFIKQRKIVIAVRLK